MLNTFVVVLAVTIINELLLRTTEGWNQDNQTLNPKRFPKKVYHLEDFQVFDKLVDQVEFFSHCLQPFLLPGKKEKILTDNPFTVDTVNLCWQKQCSNEFSFFSYKTLNTEGKKS